MNKQLEHNEVKRAMSKYDITIVCDGVLDPVNVGGLFRLSDALGVKELIFFGDKELNITSKTVAVSRNTTKHVTFRSLDSYSELIDLFHEYEVLCLEISSKSKSVFDYSLDSSKKYAIIIGNEANGVSPRFLDQYETLHIPVMGYNTSMNVVNSVAVALGALLSK